MIKIFFFLLVLAIFPFINLIIIIILIILSVYLSINIYIINNLILLIILKVTICLYYYIKKYLDINAKNWDFKQLFFDLKSGYPSVIFTGILFSFIFWARVLIERLPNDLNRTFEISFQTYFIGWLMVYFFVSSCISVYFLRDSFFSTNSNNSKLFWGNKLWTYIKKAEKYMEKYNKFISFIYVNIILGPKNTFYLIYKNIPIEKYIEFFQKKLIKFLYEVASNKNINLYYKLIFLLLLPLIFEVLIFITSEHGRFSLKKLHIHYDFEIINHVVTLKMPADIEHIENINEMEEIKYYMVQALSNAMAHTSLTLRGTNINIFMSSKIQKKIN